MRFKISLAFRYLAGRLWMLSQKVHGVDSKRWGRMVNRIASHIYPSPFKDSEW